MKTIKYLVVFLCAALLMGACAKDNGLSQQNKDNIGLLFQQVADSNKQVSLLTQQLAEVLVKMDNVISTLKELKEDFKNERT